MTKAPEVVTRESPNRASRMGARIDCIVLHHTATDDAGAAVRWLCNPASSASAHYVVAADGTIYRLVPDELAAWHAGKSGSIGIEIVNAGDGKTPFTEAQYLALERLVPYLARTYGVPRENLVGHKDVAIPAGRKNDPAPNFDMARILRAVYG
jgi:N-acetylmuramoyl-L-alanine amidase